MAMIGQIVVAQCSRRENETGITERREFIEKGFVPRPTENIAQEDSQQLPLPIAAQGFEIVGAAAKRFQSREMFVRIDRSAQSFVPGYFFQELRSSNEQISPETADIEKANQKRKQLRIGHQQFEKRSAHSVGFDEANKMCERGVGVRHLAQLLEEKRAQFRVNLPGPRGDVTGVRPLQCGGCVLLCLRRVAKEVETRWLFRARVRRRGNDPVEDQTHRVHFCAQGNGKLCLGRESQDFAQGARDRAVSVGTVCVCCSARICSRCSVFRKNR